MTLGRLRDPRLRIIEPFVLVTSETKDGRHLAEAPEIGEIGIGILPSVALYDVQRSIAELYWELKKRFAQGRLGPGPTETWSVLQRKIQEVPR